jgi:protein SCO1/2
MRRLFPVLGPAALALGLAALALAPLPAPAQDDNAAMQHQHAMEAASPTGEAAPTGGEVDVDEKLGQTIPADVALRDEHGKAVMSGDFLGMPTVLVPVYYSCPNACNILLGNLAAILPRTGLVLGQDYQVVTVSFDEQDTPEAAAKRKREILNPVAKALDPAAWRALTGTEPQVRRLMDAIGFHYMRDGAAFKHPVVMAALSPSGKIVRYLYGETPLPFDIAMAVTDASAEKPGLSIRRAVAFCYTYDPVGRRYAFDLMKVTGMGVLSALGLFALFLALGGKKKRKGA